MTLSVLTALYSEVFDGYTIFGIVKETDADPEGLYEFQSKYFNGYPIYCDKSYAFYDALGDRKVGLDFFLNMLNPLSIFSAVCSTYQRITSKGIDGNVNKGEGFVQGGLLFFNHRGQPMAAYEEETGEDLRLQDIISAIYYVQNHYVTEQVQERQRQLENELELELQSAMTDKTVPETRPTTPDSESS